MSALDCAQVHDVAPEFALGVLDGDARADVVLHLERCPGCRAAMTELAEAADSMVLLAPEAEPPLGFERRVIGRLTGDARRQRRRTVKLVASVAAAAAILSVVTVRVIDSARSDAPSTPVASVAPMVAAGGQQVGRVEVADLGESARLSVSVYYALPDGSYRVVLEPSDGSRRVLGTTDVVGGHGSWTGVTSLGNQPSTLGLVDANGVVGCSATLPPA